MRRQLLTSVALASLASCLLMGLWANLPFLLAPGGVVGCLCMMHDCQCSSCPGLRLVDDTGMGTNAYLAYTVVGVRCVSMRCPAVNPSKIEPC